MRTPATHPLHNSWFGEPNFPLIDFFGLNSDLDLTFSEWTPKKSSCIDWIVKKHSRTAQKYGRLTAGYREWISDQIHTLKAPYSIMDVVIEFGIQEVG